MDPQGDPGGPLWAQTGRSESDLSTKQHFWATTRGACGTKTIRSNNSFRVRDIPLCFAAASGVWRRVTAKLVCCVRAHGPLRCARDERADVGHLAPQAPRDGPRRPLGCATWRGACLRCKSVTKTGNLPDPQCSFC
eukprot:gene16026-biopygen6721